MSDAPSPEWWAERLHEVVAAVGASPELAEPDWDTFAMSIEVSESRTGTMAFRYTEGGPPVATDPADEVDLLVWQLWGVARAAGSSWSVLLLRLRRETGQVDLQMVPEEAAAPWRITPENMIALPEALRPRPEHFA